MLILNRRVGESIIIGDEDDIVITVLDAGRGRTRLGIKANQETPVNREEYLARIRKQAEVEEIRDGN